ncbi:hypothetical protein PVW51_23680 [Sulfitobacter sp. PR48]|uniref:hypothetical protein n=1 Tax=Sulfitobacter sp. PR48 TaxID=3028383 RepID=UPI00237B0E2C|nr:hypothetical protein [Sulfitobacter sp. PR48]MDD9723710.1 hypothetical protein [Sulfitobacter sp. PR48]
MINDAPSVRPAGRRWPGAFGLFRAWVLMFDGSNVRSAAIRQLVDEGPRSK